MPMQIVSKAVVDVQGGVMAMGAELHADEEALLLEQGAGQADLWGINLYPDRANDELIEFDSMINVRPSQGNRSRGVDDTRLVAPRGGGEERRTASTSRLTFVAPSVPARNHALARGLSSGTQTESLTPLTLPSPPMEERDSEPLAPIRMDSP